MMLKQYLFAVCLSQTRVASFSPHWMIFLKEVVVILGSAVVLLLIANALTLCCNECPPPEVAGSVAG